MEPSKDALRKPYRLILKLGRFLVLERGHDWMKVHLGGSTTMTIQDNIISRLDVKAGDTLTYYTEAPINDVIEQPPIH